jgi:hypothetical protein
MGWVTCSLNGCTASLTRGREAGKHIEPDPFPAHPIDGQIGHDGMSHFTREFGLGESRRRGAAQKNQVDVSSSNCPTSRLENQGTRDCSASFDCRKAVPETHLQLLHHLRRAVQTQVGILLTGELLRVP